MKFISTPRRLKVLMQKHSLSPEVIAAYLDIPAETVTSWLHHKGAIPLRHSEALTTLSSQFDRIIQESLRLAITHKATDVPILCYLSASDFHEFAVDASDFKVIEVHTALVHRMISALSTIGINARAIPFVREHYQAWLKETQRENSPMSRSTWAAL